MKKTDDSEEEKRKPQPATMSIEEFAEVMGAGRTPTYQAARENRLPVPVIRLGRRMYVSRAAVNKLLDLETDDN